jgi:uncharacterized protein
VIGFTIISPLFMLLNIIKSKFLRGYMLRRFAGFSIIIIFVTLLCITWLAEANPVNAQCSNPSSCKTCHEVQGEKSVANLGLWHQQHAVYDFCGVCHGGNPTATDVNEAHANITRNLQDMPSSCKNCHSNDLEKRYKTYADVLGVTDTTNLEAAKQSSPRVNGAFSFLGIRPAQVPGVTQTPPPGQSTTSTKPPQSTTPNNSGTIVLLGLLVFLILGGGGYVGWREGLFRIKTQPSKKWSKVILDFIRQRNWSPYVAGILLGLVGILAVVIGNHLLSASGPVATLTSNLVQWTAPNTTEGNIYFKFVMPPGLNWGLVLLLGTFFGGMLGAWSSGTLRLRWDEDPTWVKIFGRRKSRRFVIGFLGAIIIQYGASIAGGCTSGLAISGGMLLAPSAFLFMAGMFISGILVALLVYRRRY